jgi:hypothetical protein
LSAEGTLAVACFSLSSLLSSPYLVPRLVAHDDKQGARVGGDAMLHQGADLEGRAERERERERGESV